MYTTDEVLEMIDSFPVSERLLIIEETLRKIRVVEASNVSTAPISVSLEESPKNKKWFSGFTGSLAEEEAMKFDDAL